MLEPLSPCTDCPNHLSGIDKRLCLDTCQRLKAYRSNRDWTKEEVFIVPEGKDLVEDTENGELDTGFTGTVDVNRINLEFEETDDESEEIETDIEKIPGPVKHIEPETSWKKRLTLQGYGHKSVVEEPDPRWRRGDILHPDLGTFHRMTVPELQQSRLKKMGLCLIPGCEKVGNKRNLCDQHYKRWREGDIQHPVVGEFGLKNTPSKALDKVATEMNSAPMTTTDDICLTTININLEQYPQIRDAVYRMAVDLSLPVSHVAVTLLGEALAGRRRNP